MKKYLPISLGLFLAGVFLCFGLVMPLTLGFLLEFNVWLGVAPSLRLSEWMSFATSCRWFSVAFRRPWSCSSGADWHLHGRRLKAKRRISILIIAIAAGDPHARARSVQHDPARAVPMIMLYELGILLISLGKRQVVAKI